MSFIWATRGKLWGYRFLSSAGLSDPLPMYESAFKSAGDSAEVFRRVELTESLPEMLAIRYLDPEGRHDHSGRPILHEFVIFSPENREITSFDIGRQVTWEWVSERYRQCWNSDSPPQVESENA